ncbi:MAG: putative motility protein [Firmicutes bacterium]|nr:putative motility protein [Bacillota bacterium]
MTISSLTPNPVTMSGSNSVIGTAVLAKSLDNYAQSGEGIVKMMEQSVNPNVGKNFDMKV